MMDWYWVLAAFWAGGLFGALLVALAFINPRESHAEPQPTPDVDELLHRMPHRPDGTLAVNTVTGVGVNDSLNGAPWPLDRERVRYRR